MLVEDRPVQFSLSNVSISKEPVNSLVASDSTTLAVAAVSGCALFAKLGTSPKFV